MQTTSTEFIALFIFSIFCASFVTECTSSPLQLPTIAPSDQDPQMLSCSAEQMLEMPCRCCKMDCWYTIAKSAKHELGHIPGQAGEEEVMATLRLIRVCMIEECSNVCPRPRVPFARPVIIAE